MTVEELRRLMAKIRVIARENKSKKEMVDICEVAETLTEAMMGIVQRQNKHVNIFRRIDEILNIDLKKYF